MSREDEDDERSRQRRLEEALEVKSLRRIISAYLNYPEASEEDVKRYERSFRKLPFSHKALLPHYPSKFHSLRRCISINSYFIFSMLQAFDPPIDMSLDVDSCEDSNPEQPQAPNENLLSREVDGFTCQSDSASRRMSCAKADETFHGERNSPKCKMLDHMINNEEVRAESCHNSTVRSFPKDMGNNKVAVESSGNDAINFHATACSSAHDWLDPSLQLNVPLVDVDKVRCIIRNIVRDWAAEFLVLDLEDWPWRYHVWVFVSQGNEFSYYMMICSSFILNRTQEIGEWTIYPWIHSNCNSLSDSDQLRPVSIPDIHPASAGITEGFSMCGGDFVEVYSDPSQVGVWDAVVTCFFIDTAHNIVEYIEIISRILKDGGVWINLGPLLYHFAEMYGQEDDMSIELSLEDVKRVALHFGFQFEKERTIETTYTTNPRSMMQNRYFTAFWTARKKPAAAAKHSTE